jgi:ornithine cyclodeaminase
MHSKSNARDRFWRCKIASPPAFIDDATISSLLSPADVLSVIAGAFLDPPTAPQRLALQGSDGDGRARALLTMPALREGGLATVKVVTVLQGSVSGLSSHLLAFDPQGELLAVIEAHQLTALRTAAASILAARTLGAGGATRLAVLGAGRQARSHIAAWADALPIDSIIVWARRPEAAEDLVRYASKLCRARLASDPAEAVRKAQVVTCATASQTPLVLGEDVGRGTHVDLVGGFRPDMREADDALIARALVVADTPAALLEAGDLTQPIESKVLDASRVRLLSDVLRGTVRVERSDVTVFKSVGHAAEDLVVAELLLRRLGLLNLPGVTSKPRLDEASQHE